jgi:hypothetical protein
MPRFIISWNAGYGTSYDEVEAKNIEEAETVAHDCWREEVESNADYSAEEWDEEKAEEYGLI